MNSKNVSAAEALIDILQREGVEVLFGIPGGPNLALYDEIARGSSIRSILVKHEQAAAYAAYAYARATGKLGVCVATLGPGATNLLAGLPVSYLTGTPVLALTGQVQTTAYGKSAHQESTGWFRTPNQELMFSGTVKHTATCNDASRLPDFVRHSIRIATSGRPGPAHLIIPANILHQQIDYTPLVPEQYRLQENRVVDEAMMARIAEAIANAEYPIMLVGERASLPDSSQEIQSLAERFSIPVVTDLSSKSTMDESSPMFMGCLGVLGHKAGERYLKETSDLILAVGQTFNEISTLSWDPALIKDRDLIQLDSDPEELGVAYPFDLASAGHLPTMLSTLESQMVDLSVSDAGARSKRVASLIEKHPLFDGEEMTSERVPLLPQRIVREIRQALPAEAVIVSDSSKWTRWMGRYFQAPRRTFITAHDYEPMGWAVAGVLGVKIAYPDRPVVCVSGDGAFLMSAMELATAVNFDLDIIWLIMDDSRYGIIYDLQKGLYGGRTESTEFKNPDFVQFAAAMGIKGWNIENPGELKVGLEEAMASGEPAVLAIRFDADEIPPIRPRSLLITREMGLPNPKPSPEVTRAMIKLLKER